MRIDIPKALQAYAHRYDPALFYKKLSAAGIEFGPAFQALETIQHDHLTALGRILRHGSGGCGSGRLSLSSAWLDACLQVFGALVLHAAEDGNAYRLFIPTMFESFVFLRRPTAGPLWSYVQLRTEPGESSQRLIGDAQIFDEKGQAVALLSGVNLMAVQPEKMLRNVAAGAPEKRNWLYQIQRRARPHEADETAAPVAATPPAKLARSWPTNRELPPD